MTEGQFLSLLASMVTVKLSARVALSTLTLLAPIVEEVVMFKVAEVGLNTKMFATICVEVVKLASMKTFVVDSGVPNGTSEKDVKPKLN